jgi:DNA-binding MarR family transcriptional regulator
MDEIKATVNEQLRQIQMLMYHRASFQHFMCGGGAYTRHRGQGRVLGILRMKPEISQRELTYLLNMSKQALAELLSKLEKSGYITREPSEEDKRVMKVKLTRDGTKAADAMADEAAEATDILDCLDDEELVRFSDYLGRIIKQYERQFPDDDFEQRHRSMEEFRARYGHGRGLGGSGGHGAHGEPRGNHDDHFFGQRRRRDGWEKQ